MRKGERLALGLHKVTWYLPAELESGLRKIPEMDTHIHAGQTVPPLCERKSEEF